MASTGLSISEGNTGAGVELFVSTAGKLMRAEK